jgi:hypothetical protein
MMITWSTAIPICIGILWAVIIWGAVKDFGRNSYGNRPHNFWKERLATWMVGWSVPMAFFLAIWGGVFWW